jgi:hypothetical protein
MATGDLTTLPAVKQWLGLTSTSDDALLTRMISAYSQHLQQWISRDLLSASYVEYYDGNGGNRLITPNYPVTAVSAVYVDGVSIPAASGVTGAGYRFSPDGIILNGYSFTRGMSNVQISYTAGFAVVPPEIEQATIDLIGNHYREKDRIGISSKNLSGETISFIVKPFPDWVKDILLQYRRVTPA